jgi:hypothetical protein
MIKNICFSGALKKVAAASNFDKIVSPVGQYIRATPVPPIVRQIRPKASRHFDDELAAFERDEEALRTPESEKKRMFKPLPMAEYKTSRIAFEQQIPSSDMKQLPKAFGIENTVEATVRTKGKMNVGRNSYKNSKQMYRLIS